MERQGSFCSWRACVTACACAGAYSSVGACSRPWLCPYCSRVRQSTTREREWIESFLSQLPLHWSFSNGGQAAYMILNFIMLLHMLQMSNQPDYIKRLQRVFSFSGICVVAIGAYQVLCSHVGLPFPAWLFNSNTAWGQSYNQWFNGISRLSATFVEPSDAATFLSAWALFRIDDGSHGRREQSLALELRSRRYHSSCRDGLDHRLRHRRCDVGRTYPSQRERRF